MIDLQQRIAALERMIESLLMVGTVAELDAEKARVRIDCGSMKTDWLPWFTGRAGNDRDWWAPEPREQVMVLSPGGDPARGIVLPAIYCTDHPAPAADENIRKITFANGSFVEHHRDSGALTVSAEGKVTVIGKDTVEIIGKDGGGVKGSVQGDCLCSFTGMPHPHISPTVKESF
ncbi:phage baseplate assembly protein V [uncultured Desulfuromusa sp.]|uniref:phage baseplate assembly protein V n=1 Tax=uncultured Desulfuromusa sp. TaxID=219183 RepID=UPI002AA611C0|nr:phage baseplate assembly protein V [uncultured Desulfuromusa sp.]